MHACERVRERHDDDEDGDGGRGQTAGGSSRRCRDPAQHELEREPGHAGGRDDGDEETSYLTPRDGRRMRVERPVDEHGT